MPARAERDASCCFYAPDPPLFAHCIQPPHERTGYALAQNRQLIMSGMTTRSSNRRKTSSLAQLSGSKPPPPAPSNPATPNSRKRKPEPALKERVETFFEAADADVSKSNKRQKMSSSSNISTNASAKKPKKDEEKRLRGFRNKPPISYKQKLERAQTQRYGISSTWLDL